MVTADKVTREDLKQMQPGESQTFKLPNAQALDSAGTTAYQMARIEDCTYSVEKDYVEKTIKITKA
jgi:hypothetical protein